MKQVAFVFTQSPHGSAAGREGLDALLATAALMEKISVFFIADGVFQLLPQQQPTKILARNYIATFQVLPLYDIEKCYVCKKSLKQRGLSAVNDWVLDVNILDSHTLRSQLVNCDLVLVF